MPASGRVPRFPLAPGSAKIYVSAAMEPGLLTLAKIVGTLLVAIGLIPLVFLMWPSGSREEPKDADPHH